MKAVPVRVPGTTITKDTGNTASTNAAAQPGTGTTNRIQCVGVWGGGGWGGVMNFGDKTEIT